jgi:hypothetical protein
MADLLWCFLWTNLVRQKVLWGIGRVDSLMTWSVLFTRNKHSSDSKRLKKDLTRGRPASEPSGPKSPLGRLLDKLFAGLTRVHSSLRTPEQQKVACFTCTLPPRRLTAKFTQRSQEYAQNLQIAIQQILGVRMSDMLEVQSVLTRADMRGRGYASALISELTAEVSFYSLRLPVPNDLHS